MPYLQCSKPGKPWLKYKRDSGRLLEPGYGGQLTDEEMLYIRTKLMEDDALAYFWGFKHSMQSRSTSAIQRVAEYGDPEVRSVNVTLARKRQPKTPLN